MQREEIKKFKEYYVVHNAKRIFKKLKNTRTEIDCISFGECHIIFLRFKTMTFFILQIPVSFSLEEDSPH